MKHILLLGLLLLLVAISGCGTNQQGATPPAPDAAEAPKAAESGGNSGGRCKDTPEYHWPADFQLETDIHITVPEVPQEIQGPSPPIEE